MGKTPGRRRIRRRLVRSTTWRFIKLLRPDGPHGPCYQVQSFLP